MKSNEKNLVTADHGWFEGGLLPLLAGIFFLVISGGTCFAKDSQFPTTVMDCLGREVRITAIPERIVSTVPSNTEILYDLGLKDKVVAVTSHCRLTCDVKGKEIVAAVPANTIIHECDPITFCANTENLVLWPRRRSRIAGVRYNRLCRNRMPWGTGIMECWNTGFGGWGLFLYR